jgi:Fe/S biogenesis protein NfuA
MTISINPTALERIRQRLQEVGRPELALRVEIVGRTAEDFHYRLSFVPEPLRRPDDTTFAQDGLTVVVDPVSLRYLEGATLDYREDGTASGFRFDNPNPLWHEPLGAEVHELIQSKINPAIAIHGGHVTLLDVKDGQAYVSMGGGCQGCGLASVTLRQGVERMIGEAIPAIRGLVDTTDHSLGINPYYRKESAGQSPLTSADS